MTNSPDFVVPLPKLKYRFWRDAPSGNGIHINDGPSLAEVFEVTASRYGHLLNVWVRGPMLRKDGTRSRVQRCSQVDLLYPQPDWLDAVAKDAAARLMVLRSGASEEADR